LFEVMRQILKSLCWFLLVTALAVPGFAAVSTVEEIRTVISGTVSYKAGGDETTFRQLDKLINESVGDEASRGQIEQELISVLRSPATSASKQRICARLHLVGSNTSVPALSELLESKNEKLVEAACYALSSNPSDLARNALRQALPIVSGNGQIAIIHLLGEIEDSDSTMALIGLGDNLDPHIKAAVFSSLGEFANTPATEYLTEHLRSNNAETVRLAGLALGEAAQRLETSGHPEMAIDVYNSLLADPIPDFIRRGAFLGKVRANDYSDVDLVLSAIGGDDPVLASAAISLIPRLNDELATLRLVRMVMELRGSSQISVIEALARRGDNAVLFPLMLMLDADDDSTTFIQVVESLGDASLVPALLVGLKKSEGEKAQTIQEALVKIRGDQVDALIIDELKRSDGDSAKVLMELLARRGSYEAVPVLVQIAGELEGSLVKDALRALRTCGKVEDLPFLIDLLEIHASSSHLSEVREALAAIGQKGSRSGIAGAEVLGVLAATQTEPVRFELLHILGMIRDPAALEYLTESFEDPNPRIRQKSFESTLRIAQMSVSRSRDNPLVKKALQSLLEKTEDAVIREQATTLLNK